MSKAVINEILPDDLRQHRAVKVWERVTARPVAPERIEILKLKNKSAVYRLVGAGRDGSPVIAKRCRRATAPIERMIYEQFLPRLPLPRLEHYGFAEDPCDEFCWLFLQDAGGLEYSPLNPVHRALAARWLGTVQIAALDTTLPAHLPARDAAHYLDLLRAARSKLSEHLTNPALFEADRVTLRNLIGQLDTLENQWREIAVLCADLPHTLVHGDFVIKNVRLLAAPAELGLLVMDWECAGWGAPATDLAQFAGRTVSPDLDLYCSIVDGPLGCWPIRTVRRLAECGRFFRLLDDVAWACAWLVFKPYLFLEKPMSYLKAYETRLAEALKQAAWSWDATASSQSIEALSH